MSVTYKELRKPLRRGATEEIDGKKVRKIKLRSYIELNKAKNEKIAAQKAENPEPSTQIKPPPGKYPKEVSVVCQICGTVFTYIAFQKSARKFCSDTCRTQNIRNGTAARVAKNAQKKVKFDRSTHCIKSGNLCVYYSQCSDERIITGNLSKRYLDKDGNCYEAPKTETTYFSY